MKLTLMKSKLHRATCTEADLNYEGSISIDPELIDSAQFYAYERVDIYNINNGERFSTYVIPGKTGQIGLNGAAARLVQPGDRLIIVSYAEFTPEEAREYRPRVVLLEENNRVKAVYSDSGRKLEN